VIIALRVLAILAGLLLLFATLGSAVKTVILPRGEVSYITRVVFITVRRGFNLIARPSAPFERRDRILALYSPVALVATLATWLILVGSAYTLIFWGVDHMSWRHAFEVSGSSLFTLGTTRAQTLGSNALVFSEAAIGLFLLALLITYLPSIYTAFSRREVGVTSLSVRAGEPPSGVTMMQRFWRLERMPLLHDVWTDWERWFVDVEETHTSLPALVFLRSPQLDHSWITAAGAVLDGAALAASTVDIPRDVQAEFCLRAGYLCLRRVCDYFSIPFDPMPDPGDPIAITRDEWNDAVEDLIATGLPVKADRDKAWRDFAGWRVNYDTTLLAIANFTSAPYAPWSSDRSGSRTLRPRLFGKAKMPAPEPPPR
jgi:hypothetical protein